MYLSYANSMSLASGSWERLKKEASICTSSPFSNVGWILPASNRLKLPLGTSCDTWKVSLNTLVHGAWATFNKWSEKSIVEMSKTTTLKQTKLWNDSTSGEMLKKMHFENFSKYIYIYIDHVGWFREQKNDFAVPKEPSKSWDLWPLKQLSRRDSQCLGVWKMVCNAKKNPQNMASRFCIPVPCMFHIPWIPGSTNQPWNPCEIMMVSKFQTVQIL